MKSESRLPSAFIISYFSVVGMKSTDFKNRKVLIDMEKILTIVIPPYNIQDYLRRCLDSFIVPKVHFEQLEF